MYRSHHSAKSLDSTKDSEIVSYMCTLISDKSVNQESDSFNLSSKSFSSFLGVEIFPPDPIILGMSNLFLVCSFDGTQSSLSFLSFFRLCCVLVNFSKLTIDTFSNFFVVRFNQFVACIYRDTS